MSGSKSQSQSQQQNQSSAYGQNQSTGMTGGQSSNQQNVWQPQAGALQNLYQGAGGAVSNTNQNIAQMNPQLMQSWNNIMNPGVNPQLGAYQNQVMQNFNENIMPAIGDNASAMGGYGGTRQSVAEGVAGRGANQQMTDMASNLYNQDMNRMIQGISMAPQIANQGMAPYQSLAGILGNPTVLGSGNSKNMGMNQSSGYNRASSSGSGNSDSKSLAGGAS